MLVRHRGNCFVIMPAHVHGLRFNAVRLSVPNGPIGQADIVFSDGAEDLSLGLVSGGITQDCGIEWTALPRDLGGLRPGSAVIVLRARQQSEEARKATVGATTFETFSVRPMAGEPDDLFAGTSGATVFDGDRPVGMVTDAETAGEAWALRMDEVVARLSRWIGGMQDGRACDDPRVAERVAACAPDAAADAGPGLPYEVVEWSEHPVKGADDPVSMAAGKGAYVAPIGPDAPLRIELSFPEAVVVGRLVLRSTADGKTQFSPRSIRVTADVSADGARRPITFVDRDVPPNGLLDVRLRKIYARRITIEVLSTWGGGSPVRLDEIRFEE
ncbi:hypothetical protein [Ensifer sp. LCM 4579]|uniref:hypothetical protein n=1 Tax=Ensifer sp. LCM 4579 TaxID=1848292 RepID=UPI0010425B5D|nr:hypothetical protein [Ensifer sp. LCM 4579]